MQVIEVKRIKKTLINFGLNDNQADIYLLLVRRGNLRINEITNLLGIPRSTVYEGLRVLFQKELAEEIIENSYKIIRANPIGSIRHNLEDQIVNLQNLQQELNHLEKSLEVLPALKAGPATNIRYYSGQAGARQIFWNTLKTKDRLNVYSEWGRGRYLGIKFYQNFVAESYKRGFSEHVITNSDTKILKSISQHAGTSVSRTVFDNIRVVPRQTISFKGDTLMYDNIYAQVYLKDEQIHGFEIENPYFVKTQREIFESVWQTATPIIELIK